MKAKQFLITTLKEVPQEAQIASHQFMLRAALIKKIASGIYAYTHMGLKILRKIEAIIREEMNQASALECLMPMVQPKELWQETGRFDQFGAELLRFKDRHGSDFVLQPTSEEVVTAMARMDIRSYKQLPICYYQIQTKFRDERRPRFGVMRGREFTMKDAYSFDADEAGMKQSYETMFKAYCKIFDRLGLKYRAVDADTGSIGGIGSCEFHVLADTGEDTLVYTNSGYGANIEAASALALIPTPSLTQTMALLATPTQKTCQEVADLLNIDLSHTIKSIVLCNTKIIDKIEQTHYYLLLLRGDHQLNEVKVSKLIKDFVFANENDILELFNSPVGFLGPVFKAGVPQNLTIIADQTVAHMQNFVCGANQTGYHLTGVNWQTDAIYHQQADIRNVVDGELNEQGETLHLCKGIEVGHVFMLGTRYSQAMQATFLDKQGKTQPLVMGCYGIGVSRIMGAAIEQNYDAKGILWPKSIAPFELVICPISYDKSALVKAKADALYAWCLSNNIDVILDDRGERIGSMLADWELIGVYQRIVISEKNLNSESLTHDIYEFQKRNDTQAQLLNIVDLQATLLQN